MNTGARPPRHVPTLTEVVAQPGVPAPPWPAATQAEPPPAVADAGRADDAAGDAELNRRVLVALHRRLAATLEPRLRAALAPVVAEITAQLLRETQAQIAETLRDMVAEAVAQELARRRMR